MVRFTRRRCGRVGKLSDSFSWYYANGTVVRASRLRLSTSKFSTPVSLPVSAPPSLPPSSHAGVSGLKILPVSFAWPHHKEKEGWPSCVVHHAMLHGKPHLFDSAVYEETISAFNNLGGAVRGSEEITEKTSGETSAPPKVTGCRVDDMGQTSRYEHVM